MGMGKMYKYKAKKPLSVVVVKKPRRKYQIGRRIGYASGVPPLRRTSQLYCDVLGMTSTTGILQRYVFHANGIYDPDITGGGHQPMGRDNMALLYNHYVVESSSIEVEWLSATDASAPSTVGVHLSPDSVASYSTTSAYEEANKGQFKLIADMNKSITTRSRYNAKSFFNISDIKDNYDRLGATTGANPGEGAYYHLMVQTAAAGTEGVYFRVKIRYNVVWSEPLDITQS